MDFDLLYAFVILRIDRRDLVWINVTAHRTAEWVARQITEAVQIDGRGYTPPPSRARHSPTCLLILAMACSTAFFMLKVSAP